MILKIVYNNPNPQGSNIHFIPDVLRYFTKNRELHIWRQGANLDDEADTIFSVNQWICCERQLEDEAKGADRQTRPVSADYQRNTDYGRAPRNAGTGRKSDLSDLGYSNAEDVERAHSASVDFAVGNQLVPWSDAHMAELLRYEQLIEQEHGPEAVKELPWNKVPRGPDKPPIPRRR